MGCVISVSGYCWGVLPGVSKEERARRAGERVRRTALGS